MRATLRLFASVKPVGGGAATTYLQAGAPTGLTGLRTNPSPRSALLYLYNRTLDKLADVPESSVYRQSVEAVTKHRLGLVQSIKPAGYDEWAARARELIQANPQPFTAAFKVEGFTPIKEWAYLEGLSLEGKPYFLRMRFLEPGDEREEDAEDLARFEYKGPDVKADAELRARNVEVEEERKKLTLDKMEKMQKEAELPANQPESSPEAKDVDVSFLADEPILTAAQYV